MGKKKQKVKKECCEKYLKSGKHCKSCPILVKEEKAKKKPKAQKKKTDKKKKGKEKK